MKNLILLFFSALAWGCCETPKYEISLRPSEYVTTLVGTQSDYSLSTGNTYPAVALPWGMNFWTPQTGKMGDGWAYTYGIAHDPGPEADAPALAVDQRLRTVFHHARARQRQG